MVLKAKHLLKWIDTYIKGGREIKKTYKERASQDCIKHWVTALNRVLH